MVKNKDSLSANNSAKEMNLEKYIIIFIWAALFTVFSLLSPTAFFSWATIATMLSSQAVVVILALGLLIPLIAGDFNMSGAATLTLANMMVAYLTVQAGLPLGISILLALAMGVGVGALNGALITKLEIDPFIVTMGVGTFLSGVVLWISNNTVSGTQLQPLQAAVVEGKFLGIPYSFFYALILVAAAWYFLEYTAAGRKILFVGRGKNVARLGGIKVSQVRWSTMVLSGIVCALAGIVFTGTTGSANPTSGLSFQMPAFAAVFLSTACIKLGRFNPVGSIISVYFLTTGITGLSILGVDSYIQDIFYGAALVLAVAFSVVVQRRQRSMMLERNRAHAAQFNSEKAKEPAV